MASIATVVTMGYGSFGSINLLPTLGYGIDELTVGISAEFTPSVRRGHFTPPERKGHFTPAVRRAHFTAAERMR